MAVNRLRRLEAHGMSVWQEYGGRQKLVSGELSRLITEEGLSGVTFNPALLHSAIAGSTEYDATIARLVQAGKDPPEILDALIVEDAREVADVLLPVWTRTSGRDGFVSVGLPALLVYNSPACIAEAHRFWKAVDRPNLMVKIPGVVEGIPTIRRCLDDGLNVNVTVLPSTARYDAVADAYMDAIETRLVRGLALDRVASVASFALSPVDVIVDQTIEQTLKTTSDPATRAKLAGLVGKFAIATAKLMYARFAQVFSPTDDRWDKLVGGGAQPQRLMWIETTMQEPSRRDVLYVEELVAPDAVVTLSPTTFAAFHAHGKVHHNTATEGAEEADLIVRGLGDLGIDLGYLTRQLEDQSIQQSEAAYTALLGDVTRRAGEFQIGRPASS